MKIVLYSLGKIRQTFIRDGAEEYLKRLRAWTPIEWVELPTEKLSSLPPETQKEREAQTLLKKLEARDFLVVLDENGRAMNSEQFSKYLATQQRNAPARLVFAMGGAYGWAPSVFERANAKLSLSPLTFTYQMSALILIEQIYRGFSLIRGLPYHKE